MRNLIRLIESQYDGHIDREAEIFRVFRAACAAANIDLYDRVPIFYDDIDETVVLRVYGVVTLAQLEAMSSLGQNLAVASSSISDVIEVTLRALPDYSDITIST